MKKVYKIKYRTESGRIRFERIAAYTNLEAESLWKHYRPQHEFVSCEETPS